MLDQVRERTFCVLLERFSKAPTKSALAMESSHFQNESFFKLTTVFITAIVSLVYCLGSHLKEVLVVKLVNLVYFV